MRAAQIPSLHKKMMWNSLDRGWPWKNPFNKLKTYYLSVCSSLNDDDDDYYYYYYYYYYYLSVCFPLNDDDKYTLSALVSVKPLLSIILQQNPDLHSLTLCFRFFTFAFSKLGFGCLLEVISCEQC